MLNHLQSRADWNDKNPAQKGFTLIELLVVIIILGILAAVAIFAIGNIQDNAKESACKTERNTVKTAIAAWVAEDPAANVASTATLADLDTYLDAEDLGDLEYVTGISAGVPETDPDNCSFG